MLKLKGIIKNYIVGDDIVRALQGVSIDFRQSEFVSILGASGCGKTTLLNIIGGLDKYTQGDLVINGKSTKEYTDHDWDTYRNHSIGFVFQNYNLITHQSVIKNVELALTLSGVGKAERHRYAFEALKKVGLEDQINKKPNQLSGGQMQRVAIARALVNNPDILLADEPTGALDSETSIQIMEILKEVAKDRLVIMVTHNPSLAKSYSTRIIKLLDGKVVDDSNPYSFDVKETNKVSNKDKKRLDKINKKKDKKVSMSFFTALSLSLNNLFTKKARTILTAFAGSIGIIGIALILSLSSGFKNYINNIEKDTLSTYPITINKSSMDTSTMLTEMAKSNKRTDREDGKVYSRNMLGSMFSSIASSYRENDLKSFKAYLESRDEEIADLLVAPISYRYNVDLNIYKSDYTDKIVSVNPYSLLENMSPEFQFLVNTNESLKQGFDNLDMFLSSANIWQEMLDNEELIHSQYDLLYGRWPSNNVDSINKKAEVVIVVNENDEITDYVLYSLGLIPASTLESIITGGEAEVKSFEYSELCNLKYKLVINSDYYKKGETDLYYNIKNNSEEMRNVLDNSLEINVVGIVKPNDKASATSITGSVAYLKSLTDYIINEIKTSSVVSDQIASENKNIITGENFTEQSTKQKALEMLGLINEDEPASISIYLNSFEAKEKMVKIIDEYNKDKDDNSKIQYSDYVGVLMSSVSTVINAITYVLVAFVAISLVVSSIMIGIITYVSVLERTKEIGILRSIGASKKDIARVFNAETVIIGFVAGLLGVTVTVLLDIPINIILKSLADISNVAKLPLLGAIILITISVLLTVVAGIIPSGIASKKDPVEALRTE